MRAQLSIWPLTSTETQLELEGEYRPPLGLVGSALNAAVGKVLAEASVHRLLDDAVEQLKREIPRARGHDAAPALLRRRAMTQEEQPHVRIFARLLERCRSFGPIRMAVAAPMTEIALAGALDAARRC